MKIFLENVNLESNGGPNSFGRKLVKQFSNNHDFVRNERDAQISLCFIESLRNLDIPRVQRLDGIYYNTRGDYKSQNHNILETFKKSEGIIYQSIYGKKLIDKYFGEHKNSKIIYNGADMSVIENANPITPPKGINDVWSCAASWRPHKRLLDNIRYFLEHKKEGDILLVAGDTPHVVKDSSIYYMGILTQEQLYSVYKSSKYFLHLGWLDCCPNVVVDARACGATIVCADSGGTREIAGLNAVVIAESEPWDFEPIDLYNPPPLNFSNKVKNTFNSCYKMEDVAVKYEKFMETFI